jgi:hypothetical protein
VVAVPHRAIKLTQWHHAGVDPLPAVVWSGEARRELPVRAGQRRLVLDYFAARCCGRNVSVGDLHLRWVALRQPIADEFLPLRAPSGLEAYVQRDLVPVLERAMGRIVMRGRGWFRRPAVELVDGGIWLDFVAACRSRSPIRH